MLPTLLLLAAQAEVFLAPAGDLPVKIVPGGMTVLPNGRFLTPAGQRLYTGENLHHVTLSPNGDIAVAFHDGGFTAFAGLRSGPTVGRLKKFKDLAPCGRFSIDSRQLVASLGTEGVVVVLDTGAWEEIKRIPLNVGGIENSYVNDLALTLDGRLAYGVDSANRQLVTIDLKAGKVISRVKTGRQPYAIAQSEDGARLYVANAGLFDYARLPGKPGLSRPPFGFPSSEAEKGVSLEGKSVPGVGNPQDPAAQSAWMYNVGNGVPAFAIGMKTGLPIGGPQAGGSAPSALLVRGNRLFVSNAHNDAVQVFDSQSLRPGPTWNLTPSKVLDRLRGVIPGPLALSGNGQRLYVCEMGLNSVAVLDATNGQTLGRIPTGWSPTGIKLDEVGGRLLIASQRGLGSGPRGRLNPRSQMDERRGLLETPGLLQIVKIPTDSELAAHTQAVLRNNGLTPVRGELPAFPKEIKHVVLVTKGGHTFDGVFGGLTGANGQAEYAEFGAQGWIREKGRDERLTIMPNHLRLAERFAISDNFYAESQSEAEASRWLSGGYPIPALRRATGSPLPEDTPESGSLWEHLERGKVTSRNYGVGYDFPEGEKTSSGTLQAFNFPMPAAQYRNTAFDFPLENPNIRDVTRVERFEADVRKTFREGKKPWPAFMQIVLRNDAATEAKKEAGFPYLASYHADNDLALGRLVDYLSHQPEWKTMAILVVESGPGQDDDHVDRHRTFALCISPYAKRGYVSKRHSSGTSVVRTVYGLLRQGQNNLFDALASPLDDMFTDRPDFAPYSSLAPQLR